MSNKIFDAFNKQLNAETYSAYLYWSMAAYFDSINLKGFSNWMKVQAQEEMTHAIKFYDFIINRGGKVVLTAIDAPKTSWKSPLEIFEDSLVHEKKVTGLINGLVDLAIAEKDHAANSFLQWFIDEQVEEEASADEIRQKLKLIGDDKSALFMLDKELSTRTFVPPASNNKTK